MATGNHVGYQVLANLTKDEDLPSGASSSSITASECELNCGKSRTVGLPEDKRISRRTRMGRALPPEDAVERAQAKVRMWPHSASRIDNGRGDPVYGDRAVRVYPKPPR